MYTQHQYERFLKCLGYIDKLHREQLRDGLRALNFAENFSESFTFLMKSVQVFNFRNSEGQNIFHTALLGILDPDCYAAVSLVNTIFNHCAPEYLVEEDRFGNTPLSLIFKKLSFRQIDNILFDRIPPKLCSQNNPKDLLHCVVSRFYDEAQSSEQLPHLLNIIDRLIERGFDINAQDEYGNSALHCAINAFYSKWHNEMYNSNLRSSLAQEKFFNSIICCYKIIQYLLQKGASLAIRNKNQKIATEMWLGKKDFLRLQFDYCKNHSLPRWFPNNDRKKNDLLTLINPTFLEPPTDFP